MPDTPANQAQWPQSKSQKPGCGFPSMNLVGIFCPLTGALAKAAHSGRHTHESKIFKILWDTFHKGDLVV
ncbi:MAG: IS4 family transposase, partial [Terrimicrobiaceae bacterium]|nr:IS4 family transposase [Terrimicrobiaceae bacterium]